MRSDFLVAVLCGVHRIVAGLARDLRAHLEHDASVALDQTAKIFNDTGPDIAIDGGGKVTLSGGGQRRILYMDTCDPAQVWTTSHCQNQDHPRLTVQNLTFANGNSTGETYEGGGGGAIFDRGGRLKIVNSRFVSNVCDSIGPDLPSTS